MREVDQLAMMASVLGSGTHKHTPESAADLVASAAAILDAADAYVKAKAEKEQQ